MRELWVQDIAAMAFRLHPTRHRIGGQTGIAVRWHAVGGACKDEVAPRRVFDHKALIAKGIDIALRDVFSGAAVLYVVEPLFQSAAGENRGCMGKEVVLGHILRVSRGSIDEFRSFR